MGCKLVAYRRVSTEKQGKSGLGLEAQDAAIRAYQQMTGCSIIANYTEVETGKKDDLTNRPELRRAIAHAKRSKATLVIGKLDRLVRSIAVMGELRKQRVKFIACDNPSANELTIDILVSVAANEARMISQRTKDALTAYKARGGLLGASLPQCRNLTDEARERGAVNAAKAHKQRADEAYEDILADILAWRKEGLTLQAIADRLNDEGHTTRRQAPWNKVQVKRVLERHTD
ncbi:MAG: recombinase family protein [Isosphaeraceae bacterium]